MKIRPVVINKERRYILIDDEGNTLDDAQGYGYTTVEKARKAGWYKFKGGKEKMDSLESDAKKFWLKHPELIKRVDEIMTARFKEYFLGTFTDYDLIKYFQEQEGIFIQLGWLNYLKKNKTNLIRK